MEFVLTVRYDATFKPQFSYNDIVASTYGLVVFLSFSRHEDERKRHLLDCLSLNVNKRTQDVSAMKPTYRFISEMIQDRAVIAMECEQSTKKLTYKRI